MKAFEYYYQIAYVAVGSESTIAPLCSSAQPLSTDDLARAASSAVQA